MEEMNFSHFESRARIAHGDKYDYSRVNLTTNRAKVEIICPKHGVFTQAPDHHMRGRGCPSCARENREKRDRGSFFDDAARIHNGYYSYVEDSFRGLSEKVEVVCPVHGVFSTLARKHLSERRGCPSCGRVRTIESNVLSHQDFYDMAHEIHQGMYSYAETYVQFLSDDITVVCPTHGAYTVVASDHVSGRGCPKCRPNGSSPENELAEYISSLGYDLVRNTRKVIPPLELDIVIPEKKIAFEFNGLFWHSEQSGKPSSYHATKSDKARGAGFRLFHINESDWVTKNKETREKISRVLSPPSPIPLEPSYFIQDELGVYMLIWRGKPVASFRVADGVAYDSRSSQGLSAIRRLMTLSGVELLRESLDWPEYSVNEFYSEGFEKVRNVRPTRFYYDKKTLIRLKEKPGVEPPGSEILSVVDAGGVIWRIKNHRIRGDVREESLEG